jgi:hypothetical protein
MLRSISNKASIRRTAFSAGGEITAGFCPALCGVNFPPDQPSRRTTVAHGLSTQPPGSDPYHGSGRKACRSRHKMEQKLISSGAFAVLNQFSEPAHHHEVDVLAKFAQTRYSRDQ